MVDNTKKLLFHSNKIQLKKNKNVQSHGLHLKKCLSHKTRSSGIIQKALS